MSPPHPSGNPPLANAIPPAPSPVATLLERLPLENFAYDLVQGLRSSFARYGVDGDEQIMEDTIASQSSEDENVGDGEEGIGETWPRLSDLEGNILQDLQRGKTHPPRSGVPWHAMIAELDSQAGAPAAARIYSEAMAGTDRKLDGLVSTLLFCGVRMGEHLRSAPLSLAEQRAAHRPVDMLHASRPALVASPLAHSLQTEILSDADMLVLERFYRSPEAAFVVQVKEALGAWAAAACQASTAPWLDMLAGIAMGRAGDDMLGFSNAQGLLQCGRVFTAPDAPADAPALPFMT